MTDAVDVPTLAKQMLKEAGEALEKIAELREHKLPTNAAIIAMAARQAKPHDT